jgi:ribosomal protein S27E
VQNQVEAIRFFGEDAGRFNSCPCGKGIEIKQELRGITMKGTCSNCKREDMTVYSRGSFGVLCASCSNAINGLNAKDAKTTLAEMKEHFAGKGKLGAGPVAKGSQAPKKPKVEGKAKTDPESGAIASAGVQDIGAKVEGKQKQSRKRPCSNCGRTLFIVGGGRCFTCHKAAGKLQGPALDAALAEVKRRIDAGEICKGRGLVIAAEQLPYLTSLKEEENRIEREYEAKMASTEDQHSPMSGIIPKNSILLCFNDGDGRLLDQLNELAKKNRREPDQQILFMIESELSRPDRPAIGAA